MSSTVFIHTTYAISSGHMIMISDHAHLQVAKQARTVVTMLPTGANVVECYEGDNGVFRYHSFQCGLVGLYHISQAPVH